MATHPKRLARFAGGLYLLMCVLGAFAHVGVRGSLLVPGDAVATAANLTDNPDLFRLALVADIAMATTFVFLGLTLASLFRQVHRHAVTALVAFGLFNFERGVPLK